MPAHASDPTWPRAASGWLIWAPFLVLLVAGVALVLLWPTLPARWVVHWGPHGRPDGWAEKTPLAVGVPLLIGGALAGMMEGITRLVLRSGRLRGTPSIAPEAAHLIALGTAECVRWVSLGTSVVCAGLALALPLYQPVRAGVLVSSVLGVVFASIAVGIWRLWQSMRALQARGLGAGLEGWHVLYYSNPQDARIWVPKIAGMGYTLNFAHRQAWAWLIVLLGVPLLAVAVVLFQACKY